MIPRFIVSAPYPVCTPGSDVALFFRIWITDRVTGRTWITHESVERAPACKQARALAERAVRGEDLSPGTGAPFVAWWGRTDQREPEVTPCL
jgi:hypothetical protein